MTLADNFLRRNVTRFDGSIVQFHPSMSMTSRILIHYTKVFKSVKRFANCSELPNFDRSLKLPAPYFQPRCPTSGIGRVRKPRDSSGEISVPNSPRGRRRAATFPILVCPELFNFHLTRGRNRFFHRSFPRARAGQLQISFGWITRYAYPCACIRKIGGCQG